MEQNPWKEGNVWDELYNHPMFLLGGIFQNTGSGINWIKLFTVEDKNMSLEGVETMGNKKCFECKYTKKEI